MSDRRRLRAVVVTNRHHPARGVVLAVEAFPWHASAMEAERCSDSLCRTQHRHAVVVLHFVFDFESRAVRPVYKEGLVEPIPAEELAEFGADFGIFYES